MTYAFLPQLVSSNDSVIINVSSALAFVPFPSAMTYSATKAAVHSFTESLRVQLAATSVRVVELAPPGVRTKLYGQGNDEHAMPLDEFLDETLTLLHAQETPKEIVVERAQFLRRAEANGTYDRALEMLSAVDFQERGESSDCSVRHHVRTELQSACSAGASVHPDLNVSISAARVAASASDEPAAQAIANATKNMSFAVSEGFA